MEWIRCRIESETVMVIVVYTWNRETLMLVDMSQGGKRRKGVCRLNILPLYPLPYHAMAHQGG